MSGRRVVRAAVAVLAPGGTVLVVAHDLANLDGSVGGPQDPGVLFTPEEVVAELNGLRIDRAERMRRPVSDGAAVDTLVRATRYPGG